MSSTISPNMNLIIPGVGSEAGPTYAYDVNSSLTLVDQHDHSLGNGVQITPSGLNINADLTMGNNALTNVEKIVFTAQASNTTIQSLYVKPGPESPLTEDLWYIDGNGVDVQLTSGGLVNATIASIPGESYSGGTFFWKQGAGSTTPANFDIGSIVIRPAVAATTYGVRLTPAAGIVSQYDLVLPLLPSAQSFVTLDNSGNILAPIPFALGITASNIANQTITATQIADHTITLTQLDTTVLQWNSQTFNANGTFTAPANVNQVYVLGAGGGGGGGNGNNGGGGGGGAAALPLLLPAVVTPGAGHAVVIGAGGAASSGAGTAGGAGSNSTFAAIGGTITFPGGRGGSPGISGASGAGGAGGAMTWFSNPGGAGGTGGNGGSGGTAGGSGTRSMYQVGGTAGSVSVTVNTGGSGGGGGAGFNAGSNGGAGSTTNPGSGSGSSSPTANSSAGAGGGGGASIGGGTPGAGAAGGSGKIIVYWLGAP